MGLDLSQQMDASQHYLVLEQMALFLEHVIDSMVIGNENEDTKTSDGPSSSSTITTLPSILFKLAGTTCGARSSRSYQVFSWCIEVEWTTLDQADDWIGLDWIGLDWIGLDWIGLDGKILSLTYDLLLLS